MKCAGGNSTITSRSIEAVTLIFEIFHDLIAMNCEESLRVMMVFVCCIERMDFSTFSRRQETRPTLGGLPG
jgi:hypothetical protein